VKTAKTGLFGAWDMASVALAHGLGLMIGGMVETELSMTASASLAAGMGGFRYVDLDTFFFMGPRPLSGGFGVRGPELDLAALGPGHGVEVASE
jgi:L-alanine-DL-glutamate epimerase-like enolase superfamily enzyme